MMGLINLEHERDALHELTYFRCPAAVPFFGRYRLIDFVLSNMTRSGIQEVAIFANHKYRSLMDHLGTGSHWGLARRHGGLFIFPPDWNDPTDISRGDLRHFHNNRDYFHRSKPDYVLISGSQFIANTQYKKAFDKHLETGADVTLITTEAYPETEGEITRLRPETDEQGRVHSLTNDPNNTNLFTDVYILHKELLIDLVDECIAQGKEHFFNDAIKAKLDQLYVQTYHYQGISAFIDSLESFYKQNMNLLSASKYEQMCLHSNPVSTKNSTEPPAKYEPTADVSGSIVANGSIIAGKIENSIIFRGVNVAPDTHIKNAIIMQGCKIESGAKLENVILDKDVHVSANQQFIGSWDKPYTVAKRSVLV